MATEEYTVNKPCTLVPPGSNPTKIIMSVTKVGFPPSPVAQIRAFKGNTQPSFEFEITPRYADIFMSTGLFTTLKDHATDASIVHIRYQCQAVSGNDPITSPEVIISF
jgi:hypothetical protein